MLLPGQPTQASLPITPLLLLNSCQVAVYTKASFLNPYDTLVGLENNYHMLIKPITRATVLLIVNIVIASSHDLSQYML